MNLSTMLGLLALGVVAGLAMWVRLAPSDPAIWHLDPATAERPGPRNTYLLRDGGDAPALLLPGDPAAVAAAFDARALATPRTRRFAGSGLWVTYITRSALLGFPDFTSIRVTPDGGGSMVTILARSRFGESDLGVNRRRVEGWLAGLPR